MDYFTAEQVREKEQQIQILMYTNNALKEELDILARKYKQALKTLQELQKETYDVI